MGWGYMQVPENLLRRTWEVPLRGIRFGNLGKGGNGGKVKGSETRAGPKPAVTMQSLRHND